MADNERFVPHRELGRTGFVATALGIGDLADRSVPIETCVATARRALDAGLNVIDTAPNYEDGYSEEIVGRAVRERPRDSVFVIDKLDHYDRPVGSQINAFFRWTGVSDTADAVETKLFLVKAAELKTSFAVPTEATADVTLRRVQKLKVAPGAAVSWTFGTAKGEVKADAQGVVTIPGLKITTEPTTLSVRTAK